MKKIMFNDRYGLTQAVIDGRKTQTRRIITHPLTFKGIEVRGFNVYRRTSDGAILEPPIMRDANECDIDNAYIQPKYKVGEIVAVAQSYRDIARGTSLAALQKIYGEDYDVTAGWTDKRFVRAVLMPNWIRITNVRVERLNEISIEDCEAEGIYFDEDPMNPQCLIWTFPNAPQWYFNPREAYADLIDKINDKGTWESNPWVFVYDFELVK